MIVISTVMCIMALVTKTLRAEDRIRFSDQFTDINVLKGDTPKILLNKYIAGTGKKVSVFPLKGISNDVSVVTHVASKSIEKKYCLEAIRYVEQVVSICDGNILSRVEFSDPEAPEMNINLGENLNCHDVMTSNTLKGFLVVCLSTSETKNKPLVLIKVDHITSEISFRTEIEQSEGESLDWSDPETSLTFEVDSTTIDKKDVVLLYMRGRERSQAPIFRTFVINGSQKEDIQSTGYYELNKNIKTKIKSKNCKLNTVNLGEKLFHISVYCPSEFINYYMECSHPYGVKEIDCPEFSTINQSSVKEPFKEKFVRDYTGLHSSRLYLFRERSLFRIDFLKNNLKQVFEFTDTSISDPNPFSVAIFSGILYVTRVEGNSIFLYKAEIEKNYYTKEMVLQTDQKGPWFNSLYIIYDESFFGGKKPEIYILSLEKKTIEAYVTKDLMITFNTSQIQTIPPNEDGFVSMECEMDLLHGESLTKVNFKVNFYKEFSQVKPEYDILTDWKIYEGESKGYLPFARQDIRGSMIKISGKDSSYLNVRNIEKVPVVTDKELLNIQAFISTEGKGVLLSSGSQFQILDCNIDPETKTSLVTCKVRLSITKDEFEPVISFLMFPEVTYILSKTQTGLRLEMIDNNGQVLKESEFKMNTIIAHLREHIDQIFLEIITMENNTPVLRYKVFVVGEMISESDLLFFDKFYNQLNPIGIKKGPTRSNLVFIEGNFNERFAIFELKYNLFNDPVEISFTSLEQEENHMKMCYFASHTAIVDVDNLKISTITRSIEPNPRRSYPLEELDIIEIIDSACNYEYSQLVLLGKNSNRDSVLVFYRIEDGSDEMFRRVHSTVVLTNNRITLLAIGEPASDNSAIILTAEDGTDTLEGYLCQISAPYVTFNNQKKNEIPTNKRTILELETVSISTNISKAHQVALTIVDQDTRVEASTYGRLPEDTFGKFSLDNFVLIDGLNVTGQVIKAEHHDGEDVWLRQRLTELLTEEKSLPLFDVKYSQMISFSGLYFGWSKEEGKLYESTGGTVRTFKTSEADFSDCWFEETSSSVVCYTRSTQKRTTVFVMISKDKKGEWAEYKLELNFRTPRLRNFQIKKGLFAYAMIDNDKENIVVGATKNYEGGLIVPAGPSVVVPVSTKITGFDVMQLKDRLIVIKNEMLSKIVELTEFRYDPRIESMAFHRNLRFSMFKTDYGDFYLPKFIKCTTHHETNKTSALFCFAAQRGVYSYISKLVYQSDPESLDSISDAFEPVLSYTRKVNNLQGYNIVRVKAYRNYTLVLCTKMNKTNRRPPGMNQEIVVLVYANDWKYSHPYVILPTDHLGLRAENVEKLAWSAEKAANGKLRVTLFTNTDTQTNVIKIYEIGSFELFISSKADKNWRGSELIRFTGVNKAQETVIDLDRIFSLKEDEFILISFVGRQIFLFILIVVIFILLVAVINALLTRNETDDFDESQDLIGEDGEIIKGVDPSKHKIKKHKESVNKGSSNPNTLIEPLASEEQLLPS